MPRDLSGATLVLACALLGCAAPRAKPPAPAREPTGFRIETVFFDLPLARAEALIRPADEREATLGVAIDDGAGLSALESLARVDPDVVRAARPALVVAPEEAAVLRTDGIEASVRVIPVLHEVAPVRVEIGLRWTSPQGVEIGALPRAAVLLPEGKSLRIACLPPRSDAGGRLAVVAFLSVTPLAFPGSLSP